MFLIKLSKQADTSDLSEKGQTDTSGTLTDGTMLKEANESIGINIYMKEENIFS